jgi:hypothetical protein
MALSLQETEFVYNWQLSTLNAARDCDLALVRCVRLIIRIVMPNSAPPLDLRLHAMQTKISAADKEALVAWIRLLDDVAREGNRELCLRLQRVCTEVFHSQGTDRGTAPQARMAARAPTSRRLPRVRHQPRSLRQLEAQSAAGRSRPATSSGMRRGPP